MSTATNSVFIWSIMYVNSVFEKGRIMIILDSDKENRKY